MSTEVVKQDNINKINTKKTHPPKPKKSFSLEKRRSIAGYVFTAPWIIGFFAFMAYPLVMSLIYSFNEVRISAGVKLKFVGFDNYIDLFKTDRDFLPNFGQTIMRTLLWTPFIVVFAIFIALLLNKKIRFRGVFRLIYFLPVLLGSGIVFRMIAGPGTQLMNYLTPPDSLSRTIAYMFPSIGTGFSEVIGNIANVFWKTGVQIIIFLAGLQSIPDSLYEAAKVDSANSWDMLWKITLPMLKPVILLNTIYTIIDSFRDETNPLVGYIVKVFKEPRWSASTTMGWLYFVVSFIIIGIVFLMMRGSVSYEK